MADLRMITANSYGQKYWQSHESYAFAGTDALCPLVAQELPKAMLSMPIGFAAEGESFFPVAVQGLTPGKNLFVANDGSWLTSYIPAPYRSYPFRMVTNEHGEYVLCVDEASGLVSDSVGQPFFNEDSTPSSRLLSILEFFKQIDNNRNLTQAACSILQKYNLIQMWPITIKGEQAEHQVEGLFRIDEALLNALSGEALLEVQQCGGLTIAYCQMLSMQHLPAMGQLADAHVAAQQKTDKVLVENLGFMSEGSTFSFGN
ncbi:SapC family protein [Pseudomonas sp. CDFA 602]|uniref:SapC family protein n=1 Tax=Pseudomonas californiensis TaxID=2829823 RepID=UPI001E512B87|nr:SapC family protein [Pseudomonas californiensis]MCD5995590.1 SapC family protein [Pseudomonas californiensis]MCD6001184.1 SapC family protein [Pseudomonas californiensis]